MKLLCCVLLTAHIGVAALTPAFAQNRPEVSGEISFESTTEQRRSPKAFNTEEARAFAQAMQQFTQNGGGGAPPSLSDAAAQHLSVMYLYCLSKLGPCPFILDTVLEADVGAARGTEGANCPSMSRFWKTWLEFELEQRVKFLLSLSNMTAIASFNSIERPKYLRCKDTVARLKTVAGRYGASGAATQAAEKMAKLLSDVTARKIDIYGTVGFEFGGAAKVTKEK